MYFLYLVMIDNCALICIWIICQMSDPSFFVHFEKKDLLILLLPHQLEYNSQTFWSRSHDSKHCLYRLVDSLLLYVCGVYEENESYYICMVNCLGLLKTSKSRSLSYLLKLKTLADTGGVSLQVTIGIENVTDRVGINSIISV